MATCPTALKRLYQEGRLMPFVGAGASMGVTWTKDGQTLRGPSWNQLVSQAAKMLGFSDPDLLRVRGTDLQILEYFVQKHRNPAPLTNWLHTNMQPDDDSIKLSVLHQELAELTQCNIYYTTNYDDFLERALRLHGRKVSVIAHEGDMALSHDSVQVVKFHGDFNNPDKMVLSESDYERRIRLNTDLDLKLQSDILGRAALFIGYSFRDLNVAYLFRLMNSAFGELPGSFSGKRAYIIVFNPSDFEMRLFKERQIEVIPAYGANKSQEIAEILQDMRR